MSKFKYRARSPESVKRRAEQGSKDFAVMVDRRHRVFTPKEGDYDIRFLPPTWEDADHYGMNVFVHYAVGADDESFLCLKEMKNEPCPMCEEAARAKRANEDEKYIRDLEPKKRVAAWIINRNNEDDGPHLWFMPWTLDKDIAKVSYDHKTEEILAVDHPEDGYDVQFSREGAGLKTRYSGSQIDRRSSPLSKNQDQADEWLDYVVDFPVPEALNYYSYEHIKAAFTGTPQEEEAPKSSKAPEQRARPQEEEELSEDTLVIPSEEEIMGMSEDDLWAVVEAHNVELDLDEFRSLRAKRKKLAEVLLGNDDAEKESEAEEESKEAAVSTASRLRQRMEARKRQMSAA